MVRFFQLLPIVPALLFGDPRIADAEPAATKESAAPLEQLQGKDSRRLDHSIFELHDPEDPRVVPALMDFVARHDGWVQDSAVGLYMTRRDPRVVEPLLKLLQDRKASPTPNQPDIAVTIIRALAHQQDRRAVPALLKIAQEPYEDSTRRHHAAVALGKINDPAGIRYLVETMSNGSIPQNLRASAMEGLGFIRTDPTAPPDAWNEARIAAFQMDIVHDENASSTLRTAAAIALGRLGNPDAIPVLCRVAERNLDDELGFHAAVSAVTLSQGDLDEVGVVKALQNHYTNPEGFHEQYKSRQDSLKLLAANGSWRVWREMNGIRAPDIELRPIFLVLGLVASVTWLIKRRKRNPRVPTPTATFDEVVAKAES